MSATTGSGRAAAFRLNATQHTPCSWCGTTEGRIRPVYASRKPTGRHICDPCGLAGRLLAYRPEEVAQP